jgi:hypothetical protein
MLDDRLHRLRHRLGWQPIEVVSEWRGERLWIGARCVICGRVTGGHDATHVLPPDGNRFQPPVSE